MGPRIPRTNGEADEVRRHVLDHQRGDQLRMFGGHTPTVQAAHRMPDQPHRAPQRADRVGQVGDEPFGADRLGIVDATAAMPGRVVGVHLAQFGQPRQLPVPRRPATHQPVYQHNRLAGAASGGEQVGRHSPILPPILPVVAAR
jgi:hypothetical protein